LDACTCRSAQGGTQQCCTMDLKKVEFLIKPQCRNTVTGLTYDGVPHSAVYAEQAGNQVMRVSAALLIVCRGRPGFINCMSSL
jgi:hypothetical protein